MGIDSPFYKASEISNRDAEEIKSVLEEEHGREFTTEEVTKAAQDLKKLAHLIVEMTMEEHQRQEILKQFPKGFQFDRDGYSCKICGHSVSKEYGWYDKFGLKCMICQKAINEKIIPGSVAKNNGSWYSKFELEMYFNVKGSFLNKLIKQGMLKSRNIKLNGNTTHFQLFLIKDNKCVLPPKKFLQSRTVKIIKNGEEYYTSEYWYEYADATLVKKLSKYKITECLKKTLNQPIKLGDFYYKEINPLFIHRK